MIDTNIHRIISMPEANIDLAAIEASQLLKDENRGLKQTILIGLTIGILTIIYLNYENERREKDRFRL
jgi:hypothetical protein